MRRAMTLLELVIAIIIVGILASAAIPRFIDFRQEAAEAAEEQVIGRVRVGINTYYIESLIRNRLPLYPDDLDSAGVGDTAADTAFFTVVLQLPGVVDPQWRKIGAKNYETPTERKFEYYDNTTSTPGRFLEY